MLVNGLLHVDDSTRASAASLAFDFAAYLQHPRMGGDVTGDADADADGDWEVELVTAVVEALRQESANGSIGECRSLHYTLTPLG